MSISTQDISKVIQHFCNINVSLKNTTFKIYHTLDEINNAEYKKAEYNNMKSAYLPKGNTVIIIAQEHHSTDDVLDTLRHEVYGHAATYTLNIIQKTQLLEGIIKNKKNDDFKPLWDRIDMAYPDANTYYKAEEFFVHISKKNPWGYSKVDAPSFEIKTIEDVIAISQHLQNEIITGRATQKIVPLKNSKQFRIDHRTKNKAYIAQKKIEKKK